MSKKKSLSKQLNISITNKFYGGYRDMALSVVAILIGDRSLATISYKNSISEKLNKNTAPKEKFQILKEFVQERDLDYSDAIIDLCEILLGLKKTIAAKTKTKKSILKIKNDSNKALRESALKIVLAQTRKMRGGERVTEPHSPLAKQVQDFIKNGGENGERVFGCQTDNVCEFLSDYLKEKIHTDLKLSDESDLHIFGIINDGSLCLVTHMPDNADVRAIDQGGDDYSIDFDCDVASDEECYEFVNNMSNHTLETTFGFMKAVK